MTWEKINRMSALGPNNKRRDQPCVSRNENRPDAAYMILPQSMVAHRRVSIYKDSRGRIAFEFCSNGDYTVRPTSRTSYTMRITIPKALTHLVPIGLHDVKLDQTKDGWLIFDPQTLA